MSKYTNGKIYQITDTTHTMSYIGSTINTLSRRMAQHRNIYKRFVNGKCIVRLSAFDLFEEFDVENCKIVLIEVYPCNSKEELFAREGYHIANVECINKCIMGRTKKEHYEDNKDDSLNSVRVYRQLNIEKLRERESLYRQVNREAIRERKKLYRTLNIEKVRESEKTHYYKNNVLLITCECGCSIVKNGISIHRKTAKHIQRMEQQLI